MQNEGENWKIKKKVSSFTHGKFVIFEDRVGGGFLWVISLLKNQSTCVYKLFACLFVMSFSLVNKKKTVIWLGEKGIFRAWEKERHYR